MAIRYLDEQPKKTIRYLDEAPDATQQATQEQQPTSPSFMERLQSDFEKRKAEVTGSFVDPNKTPFETGIKAGSFPFKVAADAIGEGIVSQYNMFPSTAVGRVVKKGAINLATDNPILETIGGAYNKFEQAFPQTAEVATDLAYPASFVLPVPKVAKLEQPSIVRKVGESIKQSGEKAIAGKNTKYFQDLVLPKETATRGAEIARRSDAKGVYQPTKFELEVADEVAKVAKPSGTIQSNLVSVQNAARTEADSLTALLESKKIAIPRKQINTQLDSLKQTLPRGYSPATQKVADDLVNIMKEEIAKQPGTPAGLLKARRSFDSIMAETNAGAKALDEIGTAKAKFMGNLRQEVNGFIDKAVPDAGVRDSLSKQYRLLSAADNIAPKAFKESKTVLGRLGQNILNAVPGDNAIKQGVGTLLGAAGLSGAAVLSPTALASGLAGYGAYKGMTSGTARKLLGQVVKLTDTAIAKTTDEKLLRALRADRAFLLESLDGASNEGEAQ